MTDDARMTNILSYIGRSGAPTEPTPGSNGERHESRSGGHIQPALWSVMAAHAVELRRSEVIDDAALSAAGYLCWRGKDLSTPKGWMEALRAYNLSNQYARSVRDWATAYANGHAL